MQKKTAKPMPFARWALLECPAAATSQWDYHDNCPGSTYQHHMTANENGYHRRQTWG